MPAVVLLFVLAFVVLMGAAAVWGRGPGPAPLPLPSSSAPVVSSGSVAMPERGELVGASVELLRGRRYQAALDLGPEVPAEVVRSVVEGQGFDLVELLGREGGLLMISARWAREDAQVERPALLKRLWLLPEGASEVATPGASATAPASSGPGLGQFSTVPVTGGAGVLSKLSDVEARSILRQAWALERPGEELTPEIEQSLLSVARHETYYGRGWKAGSPMAQSRNWGAIQHPKGPDKSGTCPPGSALQGDSKPTPQGQQGFVWCYKVYGSDLDAARDLIKHIYRGAVTRADLASGDLDRVAMGMRRNGYFGGFCAVKGPSPNPPCAVFDAKMSAAQYANALDRNARSMRFPGESVVVRRSGILGVVPSTGADGRAVYPEGKGPGSATAGAVLLLLVVAGVGLAREKGWL